MFQYYKIGIRSANSLRHLGKKTTLSSFVFALKREKFGNSYLEQQCSW